MNGGARPGAGRKAHLEDRTVEEICRLSAANIIRAFRSPEIPLQFKAELGAKFIQKKIPQVLINEGTKEQLILIFSGKDKQEIDTRLLTLTGQNRQEIA